MQEKNNIFELIREQSDKAQSRARRGVILQSGAIGDCILTLPLAGYLKDSLKLGAVDMIGRAEYISIFPGRTCIEGIRSLDSVELHRLFSNSSDFELAQHDSLTEIFNDYSWVISFLGEPESDFEKNLIYTVNSTRSAEVVTLSLKPPEGFREHISKFYCDQFLSQCQHQIPESKNSLYETLIKPTSSDIKTGRELLAVSDIDLNSGIVIIAPGSGGLHKCWNLANFIIAAKKLMSLGFEVLFILGPAEQKRLSKAAITAIEETCICLTDLSLLEVLGLLSCSVFFIGNDSGITHMAAALGVKTIALFGPTDPDVYRPIGPDVSVIKIKPGSFTDTRSESIQNKVIETITKSR